MSVTPTNIYNNPTAPGMATAVFVPDQLIAGDFKLVTMDVTVASGNGVLPRGQVLGQVTASGKYIPSVKTATDGSQIPSAILADIADTTSADAKAPVYLQGEFNARSMTFDTGWTVATLTAAARSSAIFVKSMPLGLSNADPT